MKGRRLGSRLAAVTGLLFLALFVAHRVLQGAGPLQGSGASDPSSAAIVGYVAGHRTTLLVAEFVNGLGILVLVGFAGSLSGAVRRTGAHVGADLVLGSGLLFAATALVTTAAQAALAAVGATSGPTAARVLFALQAYAPVTLTIAAFVGATSWVLLRTGLFPRWLGTGGVVAAVLLLVGAAAQSRVITGSALAPKGPAALVGAALFLGWTLAVCLTLVVDSREASEQ